MGDSLSISSERPWLFLLWWDSPYPSRPASGVWLPAAGISDSKTHMVQSSQHTLCVRVSKTPRKPEHLGDFSGCERQIGRNTSGWSSGAD